MNITWDDVGFFISFYTCLALFYTWAYYMGMVTKKGILFTVIVNVLMLIFVLLLNNIGILNI